MTIRKAKIFRLVFELLFISVGFIMPLLIIIDKYDMRSKRVAQNLVPVAVLIIILLFYKYKKQIIDFITAWEYSVFKYVLLGINKVLIFILILGLIYLIDKEAATIKHSATLLKFCLQWTCALNIFAYIALQPVASYFDNYIKRETRKTEMREVLHE